MTVMTGRLRRHEDISGISGTGDVAEWVEFSDGAVAVRWHGDHPSTAAWGDIRDVEIIHGHKGATEILIDDKDRLLRAYQRTVPFLLSRYRNPKTVTPHPDHPDRLRVVLDGEADWLFWIQLFDGKADTATHEQVNGEIRTCWVSPDGDLWLEYFTPGTYEDLLAGERYDTPAASPESHDDPEVER
jgi:hypothetical protein